VSGDERAPKGDQGVNARTESPPPANPLDLLSSGELRPLGLLPRASNFTFLAEISGDGGTALAVYKPREGEMPLWDFPDGTLCNREVGAYLIARELGWPAIPPTVLRDGPQGPGSVQLFVHADPREHYFTLREHRLDAFASVAAFDVVANNADRKGGHCLLAADGAIWVVDHGVCFSVQPKLRTVIWEFAGQAVPAGLLEDLGRLASALRSGPLRDSMLALLSEEEVDATARRARRLVQTGRFPLPGPGRPYPWPPV
jgi:uncharacterized repeat protein (TIGR03843 family)